MKKSTAQHPSYRRAKALILRARNVLYRWHPLARARLDDLAAIVEAIRGGPAKRSWPLYRPARPRPPGPSGLTAGPDRRAAELRNYARRQLADADIQHMSEMARDFLMGRIV